MEIFHVLTKYVKSRLLQKCRMRERVNRYINSTIFLSYHGAQFIDPCISWLFRTSTTHNISSKQPLAFPYIMFAHRWWTNDACRIDFCQTLERIFAELGCKLTNPVLTARVVTDWSIGARLGISIMRSNTIINIFFYVCTIIQGSLSHGYNYLIL